MAPKPVAKAGAAAGRKIGPLPLWGWALIVGGGGLAVWLLLRSRTTQGGSPVELVAGNAGADAAYGGYPQGVTPAAQMLDQEVLWTIAGSLASIAEEGRERDLNLSDQISGVRDHVTNTVAGVTLGTAATTPTRAAQPPVPAAQPKPSRYYTYKPGAAPKGRKKDEAPAGKRLGFTPGKGYYVL